MNRAPRTCHHDTESLPPGGYYFAPGTVEHGPRRARRITGWQRLVLQAMSVLLVSGLIGFVAGIVQAKGWPL